MIQIVLAIEESSKYSLGVNSEALLIAMLINIINVHAECRHFWRPLPKIRADTHTNHVQRIVF